MGKYEITNTIGTLNTNKDMVECNISNNIWTQIDLIHQQNYSTGEIKLNVTKDFKDAILLLLNTDKDFREDVRVILGVQ